MRNDARELRHSAKSGLSSVKTSEVTRRNAFARLDCQAAIDEVAGRAFDEIG